MIFEFSLLGALVSTCWLLSIPRQLAVPVLISLLIFSSPSLSLNLMILLLLQVFSFILASVGMRREINGVAQKRFTMVILGGMIAIFGQALGAGVPGSALGLIGILLMLPNGITTLFFARFYERLTLRSFLGSVLIPAFAALSILFRWRTGMREDLGDAWRFILLGVGGLTVVLSGAMGFSRLRIKAVLFFWAQTWIGFSIMVLASPSDEAVGFALAASAILTLTSLQLINASTQLGSRHYVFSRLASLGLPGMIGFSALYFVSRILFELGFEWLVAGFVGFMIQVVALILCQPRTPQNPKSGARISFAIVIAIQIIAGCGLFWLSKGGSL
jgi:hypothetical protein